MTSFARIPLAAAVLALTGLAATASAQTLPTDPSFNFSNVYNIGNVPTGSPFDITSADIPGVVTTGIQVGDGSLIDQVLLTPTFLDGNTLSSGSQLNLFDGGQILESFYAGSTDGSGNRIEVNIAGGSAGVFFEARSGSTVNISGGAVGDRFIAESGSRVNITGGVVGDDFFARSGSTVNISGGAIGDDIFASSGSMVSISGGDVGRRFTALSGSTVNISGGNVGDIFFAFSDSTVNISGGTVGELFIASSGSTVNLLGTSFFLDGVEITNLVPGEPFTIADRGGKLLTGTLADGSVFGFDLTATSGPDEGDLFEPGATLTVTLIPEPSTLSLLGLIGLGGLIAIRRRR